MHWSCIIKMGIISLENWDWVPESILLLTHNSNQLGVTNPWLHFAVCMTSPCNCGGPLSENWAVFNWSRDSHYHEANRGFRGTCSYSPPLSSAGENVWFLQAAGYLYMPGLSSQCFHFLPLLLSHMWLWLGLSYICLRTLVTLDLRLTSM